jgi:hypothetical protein
MPPRHSRPTSSALICLSLATALVAVPAHAQLGALRRAAERRVEQKAEDRVQAANLIEPTFDNTTVEITAERLDRLQSALERAKSRRAAERQRYEQLMAQSNALADSARAVENERERQAYERAGTTYSECRSGVTRALNAEHERKVADIQARMQRDPIGAQNDPKVKEMMALLQEFAAAQQRGDAAAIERAQARMMSVMSAVTDSASVDRAAAPKCGARPTRPMSLVRTEALRARSDSAQQAANALLTAAAKVKGAEIGTTDVQASMIEERIKSLLAGMRQDAPITRTFTKAEYDLLVARRGALQRAYRGSE